MSLMGVVMMVGIVVSNSILIVEFTRHLRRDGVPLREAVALACRVRLRPVLMTSLATIIGLLPMAAKLGTGSEAYAPLARAIIGGLTVSVDHHGLHRAGGVLPGVPQARSEGGTRTCAPGRGGWDRDMNAARSSVLRMPVHRDRSSGSTDAESLSQAPTLTLQEAQQIALTNRPLAAVKAVLRRHCAPNHAPDRIRTIPASLGKHYRGHGLSGHGCPRRTRSHPGYTHRGRRPEQPLGVAQRCSRVHRQSTRDRLRPHQQSGG